MKSSAARNLVAEFLGTATLLSVIVGSGIMATSLSEDVGVQLLMNALSIGAALFVLITMLGPISGAHFNPAVTLAFWLRREMSAREALRYMAAQFVGAAIGTVIANVLFGLNAVSIATNERTGLNLWLSEFLATAALITLILVMVNRGAGHVIPALVGVWITSAIIFTSSTSFANPAVTVARTLSDTFTGIAPTAAPMFIVVQLLAVFAGFHLSHFLHPNPERS